MGEAFNRVAEGFRFNQGMKLNATPDSLPPNKSPLLVNVRRITDSSMQSRPGQSLKFATGPARIITDLRAYAALGTDNLPRVLARDVADAVWLDNGTLAGTLAGGGVSAGAVMLPFRPNQSPNPYMYVANGYDYQKFSAPVANVVTMRKVGIAEPQLPPDAVPQVFLLNDFSRVAANWTQAGTAGAPTDQTRVIDTAIAIFGDPTGGPIGSLSQRVSVQVATTVQYQVGEELVISQSSGGPVTVAVLDVLPPVNNGTAVKINGIFAYGGNRVVIVPSQTPVNAAVPEFDGPNPTAGSVFSEDLIASLRRGALIKFSSNNEIALVLNVTKGPAGTVAIEVSTPNSHFVNETITGIPAIVVSGVNSTIVGQAIAAASVRTAITTGLGTLTQTLVNNPFNQQMSVIGSGIAVVGGTPQTNDYLHFSIKLDDLSDMTYLRLQIDVGDGSFTQNYYYYEVRPSDLTPALGDLTLLTPGTQTQLAAAQAVAQRALIEQQIAEANPSLPHSIVTNPGTQTSSGVNQWTEVLVPISSLTRVGDDQTRSLANATKVQVLFLASGALTAEVGGFYVGGGGAPDVGDAGAPYMYRVRPRDSRTGAVGNPSPATRYGVSPRRQTVQVTLPNPAYDAQIDTWDIFRYGGSVTSWRYVGSTPSTNTTFADNYADDAVGVGAVLDFDNFEPWPTVDVPFAATASSVVGNIALVTVPTPGNVLRFLPGTLVQLGGQNVYTLWARPVLFSGTTYLFQFVENLDTGTNIPVSIYEPIVGNQKLPYMWGPDANGTVFAVGDPLRPGTVSTSKNYAPDSAPDQYNWEITPPSEPLLGGEVLDGVSYVASTERWWAMIFQPSASVSSRYAIVQQPVSRGLAAPYGKCNDGTQIFFWAKDGIVSTAKGSLTDADLYNLFPHEGVAGVAVSYAGTTIQPPDYSRSGTFRLSHANGFLYAIYQDATGTYRSLTYDIKRDSWVVDTYTPAVSAMSHPEQQAGTLLTSTSRYDEVLMGTVDGHVAAQRAQTNDLGGAIACVVACAEFDGGDARAPKQWGDFFVDLTPAASAGVTVKPMSLGVQAVAPATIASSAARIRTPASVGGLVVSDFMGLLLTWTDDYTVQSAPTQLHSWAPSFSIQPARTIGIAAWGADFELHGYGHLRQIAVAWVSTASITLTITTYDGQSPAPIIIPSSGGQYQKQLFPLSPNKGMLYQFQASSTQPFQFFLDDWDVFSGGWGRQGPYSVSKDWTDSSRARAVV
jgi:hypothetical protein